MSKLLTLLLLFVSGNLAIELFTDEPLSASPPPWPPRDHSSPPGNLFADNLKEHPLPTNAWWQNLVMGDEGFERVTTLPYQMAARSDGLHVCFPEKSIAPNFIVTEFLDNLILGSTSGLGGLHKVIGYDDLSVTIRWESGAGALEVPLVRGMGYVTAKYENLEPTISTIHAILTINGSPPGGDVTDTRFRIELNNGQVWIVYTSSSVTFTTTGDRLFSTTPFSGSIRAAIALSPEAESRLDDFKDAIPLGGTIKATTEGNVGTLAFDWITEGSGELLMMTLPHHRQILANGIEIPEITVNVLKGDMVGVSGFSWIMDEPLTGITWNSPIDIQPDKIEVIRQALKDDINKAVVAEDTYFGGKQLSAIGRLILIAEELGETELAEQYRSNLKGYISKWFGDTGALVYDQSWGGVLDSNGIDDAAANFGFGYYNDHHFHLGYFIYASAILAKGDPAWFEENRDQVLAMLRDFSNPATGKADPFFTFMRNKDWFVGHSWAAGLFQFADARNQESTSESVNAWYAVALLGEAIGDERIRDLGRLALAQELRTTYTYWQITSDNPIYPSPFADNKVVGIVWGTKVEYATFFGANTEFIHCIQMLPFTPITEELLRPEWIAEEYSVVSTALATASEGWKGFIYMAHAVIDPAAAWEEVQTLNEYDDGNTKTNTLWWVATRP